MHISDHIQEWHRQKRLIKAFIPPEFLLKWFLKSLIPYIAKDVSTYGVHNKEHAIFRAQGLDLIYVQSGVLYEIIANAPRSSFDPKVKPGPHVDGIVGCMSTKPTNSVVKHVIQLSVNQFASGQATALSQPTQTVTVLVVQSSNQKGNQQPRRNKKKGKKNRKGGNKNEITNFNDKNGHNDGGDKYSKRKVKFPCKLCKDDHLTHLCPRIDEASRFIAQGPTVLTKPLPHNENMNSRTHD